MKRNFIYKKSTGRIEMVSEGKITYDTTIFDEVELDLTPAQEQEFSAALERYWKNGALSYVQRPKEKQVIAQEFIARIADLKKKPNLSKDDTLILFEDIVKSLKN